MGQRGFKQCRDSTRERRTYVHTRAHIIYIYIYIYILHTRDCIYAESYLPRLKSHRGESRGRSALGIASARAVIPPRCASLPFALPPLPSRFVFCLHRPRGSPQWCIAAVCRCIVSIFTQGRRASGLLSFPRFSLRRAPPVAPAKGDLTPRVPPAICGE